MKAWSFYQIADGCFTGQQYCGGDVALNLPAGLAAMEGAHDHLSQRVNLATGQVEDWQPPAPPDTELAVHAWNVQSKRWESEPTLAALKLRERAAVVAQIERVEAGQPRALREAALASEGTLEAVRAFARLAEIDAQIAALRGQLVAIDAAPDAEALAELLKSRAGDD